MRFRFAIALSALAGLVLTVSGSARPPEPAKLLSSYRWQSDVAGFGGLSALELDAQGHAFHAISDRTLLLRGTLRRDGGVIIAVDLDKTQLLRTPKGGTLKGWKRDSEGLAQAQNGPLYVSFEAITKIWAYDDPMGLPKALPPHPDFETMHGNAALEALAVDASGRLFTVPEVPPKGYDNLPVYRLSQGRWSVPFQITPSGGFDPVAADFGPDGAFYLLERKFGGIGFRCRVRRFDFANFDPEGEVLFASSLGQHDNLEGLSVWRDPAGQIRLTMVSDDNFKFFQRSEIVEYVLTETLAKPPATH